MNFSFCLDVFGESQVKSNGTNLIFGGDFCPIRRFEKKILSGLEIFDDNLKRVIKCCDFAMVNLEAPLCPENFRSASPNGYGLRASPEIAEYIKTMGISAAGIANNHLRDFRCDGVTSSIQSLKKAGVLYTGGGADLEEAEKPLSININGLKICIWALAEKELNVATDSTAGTSWFRPELNAIGIKKLKESFDLVIIFLHAGHEFILTPSPRIRKSCRDFIDAGADAVIAHHPHVPEGFEKYKDGFIAYSLGNLVFDSDYVAGYENTDIGYMTLLNVSRKKINRVEIIPYRMDRDKQFVSSLEETKLAEFKEMFFRISSYITDERLFEEQWEKNVEKRWDKDYRNLLSNFSKRFNDSNDIAFPRQLKNLFGCPTHAEIMEKAMTMLEERKLSR